MYPTDLTVAAVVRHDDKYLLIEETAMGREVITQPGGHISNPVNHLRKPLFARSSRNPVAGSNVKS